MKVKETHHKKVENPEHYLIKKWGIEGCAILDPSLKKAEVVVWEKKPSDKETLPHEDRVKLARAHEYGHLDHFIDRIDNEIDASVQKFQATRDNWFLEVDAWIRALNEVGPITVNQGRFALDCLYSYAKSYADSDQWEQEKAVIASYGAGPSVRKALLAYQPEEPPDNQPPPESSVQFEEVDLDDDDEGDDDNGDDYEPGDDPPGDWDTEKSKTWAWLLSPEGMGIARITTKQVLKDVVLSKGLRWYNDLPPVVKAVVPWR